MLQTLSVFADPQAAERALDRLSEHLGSDLRARLTALLIETAHPDAALVALERWLRKTSNSATLLEAMLAAPRLSVALLHLMGASPAQADALIQNPEFGGFALDPHALAEPLTREAVEREGRSLLRSCESHSHRLDRLRYLRQRWTLSIALNDLTGFWEPEKVWAAISTLAEALIALATEVAWREVSGDDSPCPVGVAGFGKLGGGELNYSSDVDLVYIAPDGEEDPRFERFAAALARALGDRMGRGHLYRVDARLRPFGAAGALTPSMRAIEVYYGRHAEAWEIQALLRSRVIVGTAEIAERWEAMRRLHCFKPVVSEFFLDELIDNRIRIEEHGEDDDIKRGAGGIRDIEFLVQIRQLAGQARDEISTLGALRKLTMPAERIQTLDSAYTFLRQLEHRIQLVDDQQTHRLPRDASVREAVARMMGVADASLLGTELALHRGRVRRIYREELLREISEVDPRHEVANRLGPESAPVIAWIDRISGAELFYPILLENEHSLGRFSLLLEQGPALAALASGDVILTEELISGEIEEAGEGDPFRDLAVDASPAQIAAIFRRETFARCFRWILDPFSDLGAELTALADHLVGYLCRKLYIRFDVVALGSYAIGELGLGSDLDLLLLCRSDQDRDEAEGQAEGLLALIAALRRHGAPIEIDLRLRPEGGRGLLVRTYEGFRTYDVEGMEMWERFALGSARIVFGDPAARELAIHAAYALPLTPERLRELVAMKRRIETERVAPQHLWRNVKLGYGGLSDIEWFIRLHELRYPTATRAGKDVGIPARLHRLAEAQLINLLEREILETAHRRLSQVRRRLDLMGLRHDTVPENPDKLNRLARTMGFSDGNAFLAEHESQRHDVRALYKEALDRLRA